MFHCTFLAVPAVCSKTHLFLLFDALELKLGVELPSKQAELEMRNLLQQMVQIQWSLSTLSCLDTSNPPLAPQEWVADGLLSPNLKWPTFACFNSQLPPHLSLFLLLDLCRRCCSSRAWGYYLGWWMLRVMSQTGPLSWCWQGRKGNSNSWEGLGFSWVMELPWGHS